MNGLDLLSFVFDINVEGGDVGIKLQKYKKAFLHIYIYIYIYIYTYYLDLLFIEKM